MLHYLVSPICYSQPIPYTHQDSRGKLDLGAAGEGRGRESQFPTHPCMKPCTLLHVGRPQISLQYSSFFVPLQLGRDLVVTMTTVPMATITMTSRRKTWMPMKKEGGWRSGRMWRRRRSHRYTCAPDTYHLCTPCSQCQWNFNTCSMVNGAGQCNVLSGQCNVLSDQGNGVSGQ